MKKKYVGGISYEDMMVEDLKKNPDFAAEYLTNRLEDDGEGDAEVLFLMALRRVAKAYGFSEIAKRSDLGRESLYKALSGDGNPKLSTLRALLKAMGFKLAVVIDKNKAS